MTTRSFLQEQAYNSIKEMILSGQLVPDTLYSETKLAAQIGVSRTPMREALQCLVQDGYLSIIPSKGFMIRKLSQQDMYETIQVRCALEGFCVQLIASEAGSKKHEALMTKLGKLLQKQEKAVTARDFPKSFIRFDHEFHLLLIHYVDNREITQLFQRSMYLIQLTSAAALAVPGRVQGTLDEHREIYKCLIEGDGDSAYRNMIAHLMLPLNMHIAGK